MDDPFAIDARISSATDDQLRDWLCDIVLEGVEKDWGYWSSGLVADHDGLLAYEVIAEAIKRGIW